MLKFLGYCLYVYYYLPQIKKRCHILNIVYSKQDVNYEDIKAFCSFIHKIVIGKEPSNKNFIDGKKLDNKNIIKILKNIKDKMVFVYYDKTPQKKSIECVTDFRNILKANKSSLENETYRKLLYKQIVIISKDQADNNMIPVFFENYNSLNLMMSKRNLDIINDFFCKFYEYFAERCPKWFDFSDDNETLIKNIEFFSEDIYMQTDLSKADCEKYAFILFPLMELFNFMKDKSYITEKDYDIYKKIRESIISENKDDITIIQPEIKTNITSVFATIIYELYQTHRELFYTHSSTNKYTPFIQTPRKLNSEVICFKNIAEAISFIEKNSSYIKNSHSFFECIHKIENAEAVIFNGLKTEEALLIDKGRNGTHRVNGAESKEYIAIKVNYLKNLF